MQLFFWSITEIISDSLKSKQYLEVIMTKLILEKSVKNYFFAFITHKKALLLKDTSCERVYF